MMDISLVLYLIDPTFEYVLSDANATQYENIIIWRSEKPAPSKEQMEQVWEDYLAGKYGTL